MVLQVEWLLVQIDLFNVKANVIIDRGILIKLMFDYNIGALFSKNTPNLPG